jgi:hypothetical protein
MRLGRGTFLPALMSCLNNRAGLGVRHPPEEQDRAAGVVADQALVARWKCEADYEQLQIRGSPSLWLRPGAARGRFVSIRVPRF